MRSIDYIGPHELLEEIGSGGFGQVYKARHADLDVIRAVKVATDPEFVRQLRKEGRVLARLQHPRIVLVHDMNTSHDPPYIVMEYVEGENLRRRLDRGALPVEEAVRVVLDVLEALEHAHNEGVIHRDIKPSNILLDREGRAKVSDFGLGRVVEDLSLSEAGRRTAVSVSGAAEGTGSITGTLRYMSPEQLDPRLLRGEHLDARSDLYSVALVFYEMLTGALPAGMRPPLPSERQPGVHRAFDEVFPRCTAGEREQRPDSATEAAELVRGAWEQAEAERREREEEERRHAEEARRHEEQEARQRERARQLAAEAERLHEAGEYRTARARWGQVIAVGGDAERANAGIATAEVALARTEAEEREAHKRIQAEERQVRQSGLRRGQEHLSPSMRVQQMPEAAAFPRFDQYLTLVLALILLPLAVAGGMNEWTGRSDLVIFVMYAVAAVYAGLVGVRIRPLWLSTGLAALIAALPAVSLFFFEASGQDAVVMVMVIPGSAAGMAAVSCAWLRPSGFRAVSGSLLLIVLLGMVLAAVLMSEYTGEWLVWLACGWMVLAGWLWGRRAGGQRTY